MVGVVVIQTEEYMNENSILLFYYIYLLLVFEFK